MTDINQLLDELQDLVDDKRERVAKLFADIRASVPRPMTLVFTEKKWKSGEVGEICRTSIGAYFYWILDGKFLCSCPYSENVECENRTEAIAAMQSDFNAAWAAMTAKGAAHGT